MPSTINITRTLRVESETGLSGSEAPTVEAVETLDQIVSAGTEEELAMGLFKASQMQNIALRSDVVCTAQFLGKRFPILQTTGGPPGTITYTGDLTQEIFPGDLIRLEGMPAAGDDGIYSVATVVFAAGDTTITLSNGQDIATGAGGANGTVARIASARFIPYRYTLVSATAATGAITFTGDLTDKFAAGDFLGIHGSTANDGFWEITSVAFVTPTTTIIVQTKAGVNTLPDSTADGDFFRIEAGFPLAANNPLLWSIDGGLNNPFAQVPGVLAASPVAFETDRGDVAFAMVTVPGTVNSNFKGRIGKNAIL